MNELTDLEISLLINLFIEAKLPLSWYNNQMFIKTGQVWNIFVTLKKKKKAFYTLLAARPSIILLINCFKFTTWNGNFPDFAINETEFFSKGFKEYIKQVK